MSSVDSKGNLSPKVRIILLGTGGPEITLDRFGYSTLIEVDGELLLFDAGRGVLQRLYESQVDPTKIRKIIFTHLHNDHIEGLPNLWLTPWFLLGREQGFDLWGPKGLQKTIDGMHSMFHFDLAKRADAFNDSRGIETRVTEIDKEGVFLETNSYKIDAISVDHGDGNPAFGYVIAGSDWKIVLSGDCTYSPELSEAAKGADVIVHNVIALSPRLAAKPEMKKVLAKLSTPADVARIMNEAKPKLAVLSHIVKKELSGKSGDEQILKYIRENGYQGTLEMGYDRTQILVGDHIDVTPSSPINELPDLAEKSYEGENP